MYRILGETISLSSLFSKKEEYLLSHDKNGRNCNISKLSQKQQKKITFNNKHLSLDMQYTAENGIPIMSPYNDDIDFDVRRFDMRCIKDTKGVALHFFIDDYLFYKAVTANLEKTTYKLRHYTTLFAPDCSLYVGSSKHENLHAIYISRFAGAYWQQCGFDVIPVASWGDANSLSYCFEGLPCNSVIAICGIGHKHCLAAKSLWLCAVRRLIDKLSPTTLIVYGGDEDDIDSLPVKVRYIPDVIHKYYR